MPAPGDFAQRANEAIVAVLDTHATVVAITARASSNIVAGAGLVDGVADAKPVIAYTLGDAKQISASDYRLPVLFTVVAFDAATANALRQAVDAALTNPALAAVANPIDAYRERWEETFRAAEYDDESEVWVSTLDASLVGSAKESAAAPADRPPAAQSALVLAWDAKRGTVVGPAWQNGSTSGADTNDGTYVAGPPERYTFDADDLFHWGDVLDAIFTSSAGWTLMSAHEVSAPDVAAAVRPVVHKDTDPSARELWVGFISGRLRVQVAYGNGATGYDRIDATAAIPTGRRVIGAGFTPANPRATRLAAYIDGAAAATTHTPTGDDGTIADTTQPLRVGLWDGFQGPAAQRALYVYDRPLTAQEHADNRAWIVADGWS